MPDQLELDGEGPLYAQIGRAVAKPILAGRWKPGERVPSEHELMAMFGASRMTVSRALRDLATRGLVLRRRRSGTVVAAQADEHALLTIANAREEIEAKGHTYRFETNSREDLTVTECGFDNRPDIAPDAHIHHLRGRHLADGLPAILEERWINLAIVPQARRQNFQDEPPGAWLLRHVPWTEAEHTIEAVIADREIASLLGIARGEACLIVTRQTWQAEQLVTRVRLVYPGHSHKLVARFAPQHATS